MAEDRPAPESALVQRAHGLKNDIDEYILHNPNGESRMYKFKYLVPKYPVILLFFTGTIE